MGNTLCNELAFRPKFSTRTAMFPPPNTKVSKPNPIKQAIKQTNLSHKLLSNGQQAGTCFITGLRIQANGDPASIIVQALVTVAMAGYWLTTLDATALGLKKLE